MLAEIIKITIPDWVTTKWLVEGAATIVPFTILGCYLFSMIKEEKAHAAEFSPTKEEKKGCRTHSKK